MCPSLAAWALIAACHLGWAVPTDSTPMPEAKSMYSLPSRVVQGGPLSVVDGKGVAAIGLDNILLVQLFQFFKGQW